MTNLIEINDGYVGRLEIRQPDTIVRPVAGLTKAKITGGIIAYPGSSGSIEDLLIETDPRATYLGEGSLMINSSDWTISRIELDCKNAPCQGVQTSDYYKNIPSNLTFNDIRIHDIDAAGIWADGVGFNHGFYFRAAQKVRMANVLIERVWKGGGLHFYSTLNEVSDIVVENVTFDGCYTNNYMWGPKTHDIHVNHAWSLNVGPRGNVTPGGGAYDYHVDDFVISPTPGYGYNAPIPVGVVIDVPTAIAELKMGLDNYRTQLHYTIPTIKKTHFYKALVALGGSWN